MEPLSGLDQATTKEVSVFMRVSGEFNGSVYYGLDRAVAIEVVTIRQTPTSFGHELRIFANIERTCRTDRWLGSTRVCIGGLSRRYLTGAYHSTQPAGIRITTNGTPQVATTLKSPMGPIAAHVSLFTSNVESTLAA